MGGCAFRSLIPDGISKIASRRFQQGGLDLKVVERVASRWGARRRAHGYEV
jgi:hypothetical protein